MPVSRGERPVVLDPFMLVSIAKWHPEWRSALVRRIGAHEFDKIVLLDLPSSAPAWYSRVHLGKEIVGAISRSYRPAAHAGGYWIYVPR